MQNGSWPKVCFVQLLPVSLLPLDGSRRGNNYVLMMTKKIPLIENFTALSALENVRCALEPFKCFPRLASVRRKFSPLSAARVNSTMPAHITLVIWSPFAYLASHRATSLMEFCVGARICTTLRCLALHHALDVPLRAVQIFREKCQIQTFINHPRWAWCFLSVVKRLVLFARLRS